jgi:uncharacterized membrane protein YoaK (UPF0700 family)
VNERHPRLQATLLSLVAGLADAVGFLSMGGIFAANMTGNTVLTGIALADGHWELAGRRFIPLIAFFFGAMLARLLLRLTHRAAVPLLLEAALLAVVGFLPIGQDIELMIAVLAMGLQASAITHFGSAAVSTVVVTGTIARIADAMLDKLWFAEKRNLPPVATPRLLMLTWVGYFAGALAGALLIKVTSLPLLIPAALLIVVIFL